MREWGYSGIIVSKSGIFIVLNLCVKTLNCSHFEEYMFLFRGLEGRIEVGSNRYKIISLSRLMEKKLNQKEGKKWGLKM